MSQAKPIFILGITYRSGTNFLYDLLEAPPDCEGVNPYEDFLIAHSDHLIRYINDTTSHWTASWGIDPAILERALSQGLMSIIVGQTTRPRPVAKTPSVRNLEMFFRFFPDAHLLILVRDGRSVVESGVTGFGWKYEPAMHQWAEAARIILRFTNTHQNASCKSILVRYEDLQLNPNSEMQRILGFLELDPALYNFEAIKQLPFVVHPQ